MEDNYYNLSEQLFDEHIKVVCVQLNQEDNQIEVVMEGELSSLISDKIYSAPKVWKNIFAVNEQGKIFFKEKVEGNIIAEKIIPKKYVFPKK